MPENVDTDNCDGAMARAQVYSISDVLDAHDVEKQRHRTFPECPPDTSQIYGDSLLPHPSVSDTDANLSAELVRSPPACRQNPSIRPSPGMSSTYAPPRLPVTKTFEQCLNPLTRYSANYGQKRENAVSARSSFSKSRVSPFLVPSYALAPLNLRPLPPVPDSISNNLQQQMPAEKNINALKSQRTQDVRASQLKKFAETTKSNSDYGFVEQVSGSRRGTLRFLPPGNEKSKRTCSRRKIWALLCVVLCVLIGFGGIVLFLTVGDGINSLLGFTTDPASIQDAVIGEFKIVNRSFVKEFHNTSSPQYLTFTRLLADRLDVIFQTSALLSGLYNHTQLLSLGKDENDPNIKVYFKGILNDPDPLAAEKMGLAFLGSLRHDGAHKWLGPFAIDLTSIMLTASSNMDYTPSGRNSATQHVSLQVYWGPWSEWSPCPWPCQPNATQSRRRSCLLLLPDANPLTASSKQISAEVDVAACLMHAQKTSSATENTSDTQVTNCLPCRKPTSRPRITFSGIKTTKAPNASLRIEPSGITTEPLDVCSTCQADQVCVALHSEDVPTCKTVRDSEDPTGCGGLCRINVDICLRLGMHAFKCEDDSTCLGEEWQCGNGLCIPRTFRCDGQFNCFDHSDEMDCSCQPGSLRCGNNTSCLPKNKRCNGRVDCWDASDEQNCTTMCTPGLFTCTSGQCVPQSRFCDGFIDCQDGTDEPPGCGGTCNAHEWKCNNGRCVKLHTLCDAFDTCGDGSDEANCSKRAKLSPMLLDAPIECEEDEFLCANGDCVPRVCKCNGINECGDHSDEHNCVGLPAKNNSTLLSNPVVALLSTPKMKVTRPR